MAVEAVKLPSEADPPSLSKNQQKKLKRDQEWEANREARKAKRKERVKAKKLQKRAACKEDPVDIPTKPIPSSETNVGSENHTSETAKPKRLQPIQLPITFVLDCGFDDMMNDKERKSLGSQITRCYSDAHKAPYQAHLVISSFGGQLKERFDGILSGNHHSWRNVRFLEDNFVETAEKAKIWMGGSEGGKLAGVFTGLDALQHSSTDGETEGEVVYLSSDSPNTLTQLRPYSTYIIGGLVDRNRHKGVCYKRAMDRGVKTAKLPIGDYMQMTSRFVLATNHVAEIMLRWLELGDWGKAFLQVIPKRKGGILKDAPIEGGIGHRVLEDRGDEGIIADAAVLGKKGVDEHCPAALDDVGEPKDVEGVSSKQLPAVDR
ncbi:MAG: hypothetical protein Q9164_006999 [Protoblastenia rupestris]